MESYSMFFPAPSSDLHLYQPNKNTTEMVPNSLFYTNMSLDDQMVSNQDHEEGKMASSSGGHDGSVPKVTGVKDGSKINKKKVRKPRYAFQTRSHVDILDDGYRWRKYGQKAVKNNKFPRSYYKCTQQGCDVKKQVQRLSKDEEVVVTTYEGMHIHPTAKSSDNFEQILRQMQVYSNF